MEKSSQYNSRWKDHYEFVFTIYHSIDRQSANGLIDSRIENDETP
jgi:hypothetical protein